MSLREQIVDEARLWLGTPFRIQGRLRQDGVDCIGLLVGVGKAVGCTEYDYRNYSGQPTESEFYRQLNESPLVPITREEVGLGDIMTFFVDRFQHVGIVSSTSPMMIIHVVARYPRKCVEVPFVDYHEKRLGRCYRFPGVV